MKHVPDLRLLLAGAACAVLLTTITPAAADDGVTHRADCIDPGEFTHRWARLAREARREARVMRNRAETYRNYDREVGDVADDGDFWSRQVFSALAEARHWEETAQRYDEKSLEAAWDPRNQQRPEDDCAREPERQPVAGAAKPTFAGLWEMTAGVLPGMRIEVSTSGQFLNGVIAELPGGTAATARTKYGLKVGELVLVGKREGDKLTLRTRLGIVGNRADIAPACKPNVVNLGFDNQWSLPGWYPVYQLEHTRDAIKGRHGGIELLPFVFNGQPFCVNNNDPFGPLSPQTRALYAKYGGTPPPRFKLDPAFLREKWAVAFELERADGKASRDKDRLAGKQDAGDKPDNPEAHEKAGSETGDDEPYTIGDAHEYWRSQLARADGESEADYTARINELFDAEYDRVFAPGDVDRLSEADLAELAERYHDAEAFVPRTTTVTVSGESVSFDHFQYLALRTRVQPSGVYFALPMLARGRQRHLTEEVLFLARYNPALAREYLSRQLALTERFLDKRRDLVALDITAGENTELELENLEAQRREHRRLLRRVETLEAIAASAGSAAQRDGLSRIRAWLEARLRMMDGESREFEAILARSAVGGN